MLLLAKMLSFLHFYYAEHLLPSDLGLMYAGNRPQIYHSSKIMLYKGHPVSLIVHLYLTSNPSVLSLQAVFIYLFVTICSSGNSLWDLKCIFPQASSATERVLNGNLVNNSVNTEQARSERLTALSPLTGCPMPTGLTCRKESSFP